MAKTTAKQRILDIIIKAGSRGVTTWQLIDETRHSAAARRVWDWQQEGYRIRKVKDAPGVYRWIYDGPPVERERLTQGKLFDMIQESR